MLSVLVYSIPCQNDWLKTDKITPRPRPHPSPICKAPVLFAFATKQIPHNLPHVLTQQGALVIRENKLFEKGAGTSLYEMLIRKTFRTTINCYSVA